MENIRAMKSEDLSDEKLIDLILRRDESALERLYERYASALMGLALKMLGDRIAADEAVQETFWKVWNKAETYVRERGAVLSWLFGITHHLCIDMIRRQRADVVSLGVESIGNPVQMEMGVADKVNTASLYKQVQAALDMLPPEQRQAIEMAYFGGMTRQEIAGATGVPLGTVHTRVRLALQKLKNELRIQGIEEE